MANAKPKTPEPLTVAEFCEAMKIERSTFYEWRQKRRAPRCIKLPNGKLRIRWDDYQEWLDNCEEAA